jgi:tRNA/rRNA methyltransferase
MNPTSDPPAPSGKGSEELLDRFRIVLVRPKDSRNLGMVSRAMMNMGFRHLVMVNPRCEINEESYMTAVGCREILDHARIVESILDGVRECSHVIGTTRRVGRGRSTTKALRPLAQKWIGLAKENEIAILFGPEDRGLSTEDLKICRDRVRIPTADPFPSLNLAQAVLIVSYEILSASQGEQMAPPHKKVAPMDEQERLFADMQKALEAIQYFGARNPDYSMQHFRDLFTRAAASSDDVRLWRGIFTRLIRRLKTE